MHKQWLFMCVQWMNYQVIKYSILTITFLKSIVCLGCKPTQLKAKSVPTTWNYHFTLLFVIGIWKLLFSQENCQIFMLIKFNESFESSLSDGNYILFDKICEIYFDSKLPDADTFKVTKNWENCSHKRIRTAISKCDLKKLIVHISVLPINVLCWTRHVL